MTCITRRQALAAALAAGLAPHLQAQTAAAWPARALGLEAQQAFPPAQGAQGDAGLEVAWHRCCMRECHARIVPPAPGA